MDELDKKWIDNATYEQLLHLWRNAPPGTKIFQGESGEYYRKIMSARKEECADPVAVSKKVGWK